ncbi:MAG: hypothetical protein ACFFD4_09175 [Candidatus Odinarchaeota archaeon]
MNTSDRRSLNIEDKGHAFDNWEINLHSSTQFEVLVDYLLDPDIVEARFNVELYFFIPSSFRINKDTYTKHDFYQDMQAYIRFIPKLITLSNVINESNEISPLVVANSLLDEIFKGDSSTVLTERIVHELKMLANVVRTYMRKEVQTICSSILSVDIPRQVMNDVISNTIKLTQDIRKFHNVLSEIRPRYLSSVTPLTVRETYEFTTEYISLNLQRELTKLLNHVKFVSSTHRQFEDIIDLIKQSIKYERDFRIQYSYPSILIQGGENESFAYRHSILKKFTSNVLYLTARPVSQTRAIQEIGYAAAAGFAMLVALLITFYAQEEFGPYTLPFVVVVVIGYMIKDRLKEWGRFLTKFGAKRNTFDYKSKIRDREENIIGYSQESFRFIDYDKVPSDVLQLRSLSALTAIEEEGKPQDVIRYIKIVRLLPKQISDAHVRVLNTSDIIRFDISSFLSKIENPYEKRLWYNVETNDLEYFTLSREYHLNLILKFVSSDNSRREECHIDRVRLILDKNGIKRIEAGEKL